MWESYFSTKKVSSNMSYRQLTEGQRYQISALLSEEFSQREIARKLNTRLDRPSRVAT